MKIAAKPGGLIAAVVGIGLVLVVAWLATTDHKAIWPIRNTLQYHLLTWVSGDLAPPEGGPSGRLTGTIRNRQNRPIEGAWVLAALPDGTTYSSRSDAAGRYTLDNIPPGAYLPVAGAPSYASVRFGNLFGRVKIRAGAESRADVTLPPELAPTPPPARDLRLGEAAEVTCSNPVESSATRRQVHFKTGDRPNQPTLYYTPLTATTTSRLPVLLAVYPGPADSWECVSLALAEAGYAIVAAGPAYSFDLEADIDELEGLLAFARAGEFPGGDGSRIGVVGGSYSGLHVLRLLQRDAQIQAALLLGAPTDLFDMRRRLEEGSYIPPFGLDQALIALGLPSQEPLRYWRYSGAYHVDPTMPPLALLHSRSDEVVPYQQTELLVANLAESGVPHETHFFEGASHYLLAEEGDPEALEMYRITLDFLGRYLKKGAEP